MTATNIGPDFLMVELTAAGVAFAKGSPLRISNGRTSLVFAPGVAVKIARFEWDMLLKNHSSANGATLFAITTAAPVTTAAPAVEDAKEKV